jgi:hypothetical protein
MKAYPYNPQFNLEHGGMDLRDYFAGKAMQSIILKEWDNYYNTSPHEDNYREITLCLDVAYEIADAMMEVRKCK